MIDMIMMIIVKIIRIVIMIIVHIVIWSVVVLRVGAWPRGCLQPRRPPAGAGAALLLVLL